MTADSGTWSLGPSDSSDPAFTHPLAPQPALNQQLFSKPLQAPTPAPTLTQHTLCSKHQAAPTRQVGKGKGPYWTFCYQTSSMPQPAQAWLPAVADQMLLMAGITQLPVMPSQSPQLHAEDMKHLLETYLQFPSREYRVSAVNQWYFPGVPWPSSSIILLLLLPLHFPFPSPPRVVLLYVVRVAPGAISQELLAGFFCAHSNSVVISGML